MANYGQGDIISIGGFRYPFLVLSNNAFIRATKVFHVCPFLPDHQEGPLHIRITGVKGTEGVAILEQVKLIDPAARRCRMIDRVSYSDIMNVSDALQGMFEYD